MHIVLVMIGAVVVDDKDQLLDVEPPSCDTRSHLEAEDQNIIVISTNLC